jgi:serine/threonine-protein kinase
MELPIGGRYLLVKPIQTRRDGMLYSARDLSLHRDVLLYLYSDSNERREASLQALGPASRFSNEQYMHILDAGMHEGSVYAVLNAPKGAPLAGELHRHTLTPAEILHAIFELAKGMQNGMEEKILGFPVTADNIWLAEDKRLVVMNFWAEGDPAGGGTQGLCSLLYQMAVRTEEVPKPFDGFRRRLSEALAGLPPEQSEAVMSLIWRVFLEKEPMSSFVLDLRAILERMKPAAYSPPFHAPAGTPGAEPPEPAARIRPEDSPRRQLPVPPALPLQGDRTAAAAEVPRITSGAVSEAGEDGETSRRGGKLRFTLLVTGSGLVAAVVFVAVMALLLNGFGRNEDRKETEQPQIPPAAAQGRQPPADTTGQPQNDKAKSADSAGSEPLKIPDLAGMTQKEAEQILLEKHLHYYFELKPNDKPAGTVFKQQPEANTPASEGDTVNFWVSKGR